MKALIFKIYLFSLFFTISNSTFALSIQVNDNRGKALSDVVVYAEPLDKQTVTKTSKKLVISQRNKAFTPYISVTQTGNPLLFRNQDDITHHIYTANGSKNFAFLIRPGQEVSKESINESNEMVMGCNVHDWMSGYLLVLDTPYFEKTNKKGIANLNITKQGKYKITVWHPQFKEPNNRISMQVDTQKAQQFNLNLTQKMGDIPEQKSDADFDFLSDY